MPPQEVPVQPSQPIQPNPASPRIGKFRASGMIVRESWTTLMNDKEIMWFPTLSALVSIIALGVLAASYYFISGNNISVIEEHARSMDPSAYLFLLLYYIVMFFIVSFFQAGIFIIAHARFNGQDLHFSDGIKGAVQNSGKILGWAVISATVGVILNAIANRSKIAGAIVSAILGAAWNMLAYFSLPSLVIGKTSLKGAFTESASIIRKTWGEVFIVNIGVGFYFGIMSAAVTALGVPFILLVPVFPVVMAVIMLLVVVLSVIGIVSSSLNAIFKLALYEYARTGKVPQGFSPELVQNPTRLK